MSGLSERNNYSPLPTIPTGRVEVSRKPAADSSAWQKCGSDQEIRHPAFPPAPPLSLPTMAKQEALMKELEKYHASDVGTPLCPSTYLPTYLLTFSRSPTRC